jgi:hypothetical protein
MRKNVTHDEQVLSASSAFIWAVEHWSCGDRSMMSGFQPYNRIMSTLAGIYEEL